MCSQKCARPKASLSSINEPTPTDRLAADLEALGSEISKASILFGSETTRKCRCSDKGLIISILFIE